MSTVFEPPRRHKCHTPGSLRPTDEWPREVIPLWSDTPMPIPTLYEVGSVWQCGCGRWWHATDVPPNPPGGPYHGGGRIWKRVKWWNFAAKQRIREAQYGPVVW